ncbi:MAG TPA: glucose 1-dehydrogenase [Abditibacteriaceae bacterium]|jgi:3-oxoacyl-[acyl-carrier protein] reductase
MLQLNGKHIFIAGGSRGIGAAAARTIAAAGGAVSLSYRTEENAANALVAEIQHGGGKAAAWKADVTDEMALRTAMQSAVSEFGPLDGLVVSAGIFEGASLQEMTVDFWERTMSINVRGTFLCVKTAVEQMRAEGEGGSIVIYASTAGQRGSAGYSAYATSKGAQIMFMRSMALELAPDKIRVNCIAPAWTETDMAHDSLESLGRDKVAASFPLGRIGQPQDVAGATAFLLSDMAAFITGSTVTVDGGMDMRG